MIIRGDSLKVLRQYGDNTLDGMTSDPPYGYSFMGKDWDQALPDQKIWEECLRVMKPGTFGFVMSAPRQDVMSRMIISLEDAGFKVNFTPIFWAYASGFPKAGNTSKLVDKKLGCEREVIGEGTFGGMDKYGKDNGYRGKEYTNKFRSSKPLSDQAKELDGSYLGFQPKPAVEVILTVMKPLSEKNYLDQAMKDGKGVTWLDDCRIPHTSQKDMENSNHAKSFNDKPKFNGLDYANGKPGYTSNTQTNMDGRMPANLLVSDDVLNDGKTTKSNSGGIRKAGSELGQASGWNDHTNKDTIKNEIHDSGSFSRYFDLDAWSSQFLIVEKPSRSEKEAGLHPNKTSLAELCTFEAAHGIFPEQSNDGRQATNDTAFQRGKTIRLNNHPTVKAISLMAYLITLATRKDDTILDPFAGSGTTAIASGLLGRNSIGIEQDHHNCIIANQRLKYWKNKSFSKVQKIIQQQEKKMMNMEAYF